MQPMCSTPGRVRLYPILVVALFVVVLAACDWTQVGFDAAGTRAQPNETAINRTNVKRLVVAWSTPPGVGDDSSNAPATVSNGTLFSASGGELRAYDAAGVVNCAGS